MTLNGRPDARTAQTVPQLYARSSGESISHHMRIERQAQVMFQADLQTPFGDARDGNGCGDYHSDRRKGGGGEGMRSTSDVQHDHDDYRRGAGQHRRLRTRHTDRDHVAGSQVILRQKTVHIDACCHKVSARYHLGWFLYSSITLPMSDIDTSRRTITELRQAWGGDAHVQTLQSPRRLSSTLQKAKEDGFRHRHLVSMARVFQAATLAGRAVKAIPPYPILSWRSASIIVGAKRVATLERGGSVSFHLEWHSDSTLAETRSTLAADIKEAAQSDEPTGRGALPPRIVSTEQKFSHMTTTTGHHTKHCEHAQQNARNARPAEATGARCET